jgi:hypothetical protein
LSTTIEEKREEVPWIPLILLTAFLSFLAIVSYRFLIAVGNGTQCVYNFGVISQTVFLAVYPPLLLALAYPFRKRLNLSPSKLTYLYTAGVVSSMALGFGFTKPEPVIFARYRIVDSMGLLNIWWEPPLSTAQAMIQGGIATDWIAWGPSILVISLLFITFFFFTSSFVLIFRRSWFDVEKIPFPLVLATYELTKVVQSRDEKGYTRGRPFLIGILLGFVFMVPLFMARTFPWFPDIYGWRNIAVCSAYKLPENSPFSYIVGMGSISVDPISVALFFLAPLSISFNVWFWTIAMYILDQIAFYMGYNTEGISLSGWARVCCNSGPGAGPPFYWPNLGQLGGFVALTVMFIFIHRSYVLDTMRTAIHGPNPEREKDEVMSYRSMYIMLLLSAAMGLVCLMIMGQDFAAALVTMLTTCFTTWFAMTLIFGMGGMGASDRILWTTGYLRVLWPDPSTAPTNLDYVMSHYFAENGQNEPNYVFGNGFYVTAQCLKMSSLTGASNRNTFLVAAVCWVVAMPIIFASSVWSANLYGSRVLSGWGSCAIQDICETSPALQASRPASSLYLAYGTAGFVFTAFLSYMHARFVWFPFEPIGFVIATSFPGQSFGVWSAFLVAWVAKTIVLRTGGSALYEKYALPLVGGFITGVVLASMMGIITGMVRFFIPF